MTKRFLVLLLASAASANAQTFTTPDPALQRIWDEGKGNSQAAKYLQVLSDSIGPRLTGSPGHKAGNDWLVKLYSSLGIEAKNEQYGTWRGWRRGPTHVDLLTPRVRTLEGLILAWSPGTGGRAVDGQAVVLTNAKSRQEFESWLPSVRGKFVLVSFPQPTCRPDNHWEQNALPETFRKMQDDRNNARSTWSARTDTAITGVPTRDIPRRLEQAGALGVISSNWSDGWGVEKVFQARTQRTPAVQLSCEDYGLVYRLAENGDNPTVRVTAESEDLGEVPVFNTVATIKGSQLPNEYVMFSAHFDSWDASSGTTDNGTGTIVMLEAMRILKAVYPNPKRTILVGHWGGEEQGLNGSRAFAADHPEIIAGLQALFNQDNGTGRIQTIGMNGMARAGELYQKYYDRLPKEITAVARLNMPGSPPGGGSDHASFACHPYGAPTVGLGAQGFDYSVYTWHTNRDTYDKASFEDIKHNATLTAMLAYMAAEDPQKMPRDRVDLAAQAAASAAAGRGGGGGGGRGGRGGGPPTWPNCTEAQRNSTNYFR